MVVKTYDPNDVIKLFKQGVLRREIAAIVGISDARVGQLLTKFEVPRRYRKKIDKAEIVRLYGDGKSAAKISAETKVSMPTIYRVLATIPRRDKGWHARTHTINDKYFDNLTPESAYWFGMLCADGSVSKNRVRLTLKLSDGYHVERFLKAIGSNLIPRIETRKSGHKCVCIMVGCRRMRNALDDLGFTDFKNGLPLSPHILTDNLFWHWLRGFSDGDGSVALRKPKRCKLARPIWSVVSPHKSIAQWLSNNLSRLLDVPPRSLYFGKSVYYIRAERRIAMKILRAIYSDVNDKLDRKWQKYLQIEEQYAIALNI